ncbi:DNA-directed RNA polymerase subunit alpha [Patescibacteria group bacterium]
MIKPSFKTKILEDKSNYSKFVMEPLEQGYGRTLGNSLRRSLLSNIGGAAITKVKIEGVRHQFSTLKGMKEDIVELILNLKQVVVIYKGEEEVKLSLKVKGPKEVKAGDIKAPAEVKIINKKLKLAHLTDSKTNLNVDIWVACGYGYSPAEERKTNTLGIIPVDASFSPIIKVNYKVEATRVGRRTDFDRLILEMWTNGAIKPKKSLEESAKILTSYFKQIYKPVYEKAEEEEVKVEENESLKLTVEELNLPTRIANALRRGGYPTVESLSKIKKEELNKVKNLGIKSIEIIQKKLLDKGVTFKDES